MAGEKITNKGYSIRTYALNQVENDKMFEKKLEKLSKYPKASSKEKSEKEIMMKKAEEFVENNIPFEIAPIELQSHHFFKIGYEVAMRKKKILEMQSNKDRGGR